MPTERPVKRAPSSVKRPATSPSGEMGFITAPNELFSTIGLHVRLHGPFENTFIITGNKWYVPCMAAYEYGAYEAVCSFYAKGTAEKMADTFVELLEKIR